jgi:hypothetical protein
MVTHPFPQLSFPDDKTVRRKVQSNSGPCAEDFYFTLYALITGFHFNNFFFSNKTFAVACRL